MSSDSKIWPNCQSDFKVFCSTTGKKSEDEIPYTTPGEPEKINELARFNIEIPEILHVMFQYFTIREIVRISSVSRTFYQVATNDLLWKQVMERRIEYGRGCPHYTDFKDNFFDKRTTPEENIFEETSKWFRGQHERDISVREEERERRRQADLASRFQENFIRDTLSCPVLSIIGLFCSCLCPPIAILVFGLLANLRAYKPLKIKFGEDRSMLYSILGAFMVDPFCFAYCGLCGIQEVLYCVQSICGCCFTGCFCCGLCAAPILGIFLCVSCVVGSLLMFVCSPLFAIFFGVVWNGRVFVLGDVEYQPYTIGRDILFGRFYLPFMSPTVLLLFVATSAGAGIGVLIFSVLRETFHYVTSHYD